MVKNLPAMQETWIWSLGREDPLEKGMATHFSILAWRIPWTEKPDGLQSMGLERVGHDWVTNTHTHTHTQGEDDFSLFFTVGWEQNAIEIFMDDNNNDNNNLQ